jgi:hypothetical protein
MERGLLLAKANNLVVLAIVVIGTTVDKGTTIYPVSDKK